MPLPPLHPSLQRRGNDKRHEMARLQRQKRKAKTLDPNRLSGSPIESGTSVEDDRRGGRG